MSLKQLAIGVAIVLYALANLSTKVTYRMFLYCLVVVGILWVLEQLVPALTTVKRPVRAAKTDA